MHGNICDPVMTVSSPGGAGSTDSRLGFPRREGRYRPWGVRFRSRFIGVADLWKNLLFGDRTLSFPDAAGRWRSPGGRISARAPRPLTCLGRAGGAGVDQ